MLLKAFVEIISGCDDPWLFAAKSLTHYKQEILPDVG
jgi:hypothetical protein